MITRLLKSAAVCGSMLILVACATGPDPSVRPIAQAESKIETAEESGAARSSPEAMASARKHLAAARAAADEGESEEATRLATKARLDAELAIAQADSQEAQQALEELEDSLQALRNEISRNQSR